MKPVLTWKPVQSDQWYGACQANWYNQEKDAVLWVYLSRSRKTYHAVLWAYLTGEVVARMDFFNVRRATLNKQDRRALKKMAKLWADEELLTDVERLAAIALQG